MTKKPDALEIRPVQPTDAAALAELSGALGYPAAVEDVRRRLAAVEGSADHAAFAAVAGEEGVVGWVHVFRALRLESDPFAELGGLVVAEAYRRRGVGARLVERAAEWAREQGVARLRVRSRSERRDAHRFYERLGFRRSKEQQVLDRAL